MATAVLGRARPRSGVLDTGGPVQWFLRISVIVGVLVYPALQILHNEKFAQLASQAVIYGIVGLSLNVLIGYLGQLSLGHQGFVGIGALFAAYVSTVGGLPFFVCLAMGALTGAVAALLLGLVALRITGLYLALVTLVFGITLQDSLFEVGALTNKGAGQPANRPSFLLENRTYFLVCLGALALVFYLDRRLTSSKGGRALLAIKENERVAEAFGVNVTAYKLLAFTFSGAAAGLGGSLLAFNTQQFNANSYGFPLALTFVIATVVGGTGSRVGVIIGAVLFTALTPFFTDHALPHFRSLFGPLQDDAIAVPQLIGAALLLLTLVQFPGGLGQQLRPWLDWLSGKRFNVHADKEASPGAVEGSSVRA